ncbi:ankyrin repeat domain-containing protein [Brevundimonas sp.]|uniref:ankyrin repeat domain-containing protein n=1 Tax=Brevundimonas sp. TaxID=1871086 RepID=UPI002D6D16BA|nr:ankyrin repeat domain-containing protein [Brevundimonas sp.]HYC97874.1 ankyrin repeat domain-containing protein [Brevundimonas sp.]
MPKARKKLLPKDFDTLLKAGDIAPLKAVFETCELDARGGYGKHVALAFRDCPDELARWLIGQGADIEARDAYGRTPLHDHAASWQGRIETLLDLGADIQAVDKDGDTPLHKAAKSANLEAVRVLRDRGAPADALNASGLTPLAAGLQHCSNIQIEPMGKIADLLLAAPAPPPRKAGLGGLIKRAFSSGRHDAGSGDLQLRGFVQRIGENFEFHRAGFNPEYLEGTSAALDRLYALFGVPPVPRRLMHDGDAPIIARSVSWQDQHQELWALLVPSKGAAATVQGEVIRIAGRVADEIDRNGGVNWDADFGRMTRAFLTHVGSGSPLSNAERDRAERLVATVRKDDGAGAGLCELAVQWVTLNPAPIPLSPPDYGR